MTFNDVLEIKNGRNQKAVENPDGKYPIYGSGGIMGHADDYICEAETVIVGRKGSINNPIFVEEPFWNVDTAFGLTAKKDVLMPRYLYYFCMHFDFERLNKAVTIPSLTKSDLLKIEITLPGLNEQQNIVDKLQGVERILFLHQEAIAKLDELIKARFVEMFGDMLINPKGLPVKRLDSLANIVSGITKGRKVKTDELYEVPYMAVSNVKDGYIDWTTVKTIMATGGEIDQYRLMPGDVLMTEGGDPDKLGRGAIIHEPPKDCIHQNHIFRVRLKQDVLLSVFMAQYLQQQKAKKYFLECAKQTTGIASINKKQLSALPVLVPPMKDQKEYVEFVSQVDKSKFVKNTTRYCNYQLESANTKIIDQKYTMEDVHNDNYSVRTKIERCYKWIKQPACCKGLSRIAQYSSGLYL